MAVKLVEESYDVELFKCIIVYLLNIHDIDV